MKKIDHLPAIPLITHDPYFSLWDVGKHPAASHVRHWTGAEKHLQGNAIIDGTPVRFLGRSFGYAMKCVETDITPLSTRYVFQALGVQLEIKFTSPLLLDDLDILSTPISYLQIGFSSLDNAEHTVEIQFSASANVCYSGEIAQSVRMDFFRDQDLNIGLMGRNQQTPLNSSGDSLTIDWGYLLFASSQGILEDGTDGHNSMLRYRFKAITPADTTLLIGYDDIASINYFGRFLPAYYARNGKTIIHALKEFHVRQEEILSRCVAFDRKLLSDAFELGGTDYATIVTAAYRQSIAAHKLVADEQGELLFISKENNSNGCGATVDVSYPSIPLYLLYCPELVRAMCRPVIKFAKMPVWPYDFAPHDIGRYPILNGQVYAARNCTANHQEGMTPFPYYYYPESVDAYDFKSQMPVEECGNMLLMTAAAGFADGNWSFARENLPLLQMWSKYLIDYGEDPGEQLCTDDFAGHLARNVNLSAKAIMGVAAFALILEKLGHFQEAKEYSNRAHVMGKSWLERADAGGYTYLTFDKTGWSQKYNLVWDKLFGWNILPEEFYERELLSYLPRINTYGLPLDSRAPYTKSDWTMWIASMTESKAIFDALCAPIAKYLRESKDTVPFTDFYDTEEGTCEAMFARSVQGGCFMPLLMKKWHL